MASFVLLIRIVISTGIMILLPGYLLSRALFPKEVEFNLTQWITISGGFGIILTILAGVLLIVTGYGFSLQTYLPFLGGVMILVVGSMLWRSRGTPLFFTADWPVQSLEIERFIPVLTLIGLLTVLTVIFPFARPVATAEQYTEFYVLEDDRLVATVSDNLEDKSVALTFGIINHEHVEVTYLIQVELAGQIIFESEDIQLAPETQWEDIVTFPLSDADLAASQQFDITLLLNGNREPYRQLHVWLDTG